MGCMVSRGTDERDSYGRLLPPQGLYVSGSSRGREMSEKKKSPRIEPSPVLRKNTMEEKKTNQLARNNSKSSSKDERNSYGSTNLSTFSTYSYHTRATSISSFGQDVPIIYKENGIPSLGSGLTIRVCTSIHKASYSCCEAKVYSISLRLSNDNGRS